MWSPIPLCYLFLLDGSQDHRHDGQEKWIVEIAGIGVQRWRLRLANGTFGEQLLVALDANNNRAESMRTSVGLRL